MFEIKADPEKNRLYITLGRLDLETVKEAVRVLGKEVWKLSAGFTVLNDLSEYSPVSQEVALHIRRGQGILKKAGMGRGVRVVSSSLADLQFSRRASQAGLEVTTVKTLEEAWKVLEEWEREDAGKGG
ncbi:MAG: hypothetical protein JRI97_09425 [Deltaproteobacteria bacterium]|nr:hypothetical protein [Deltaproteobacteria bacterium]